MPRNILSILEQIGADTKRTHKLRILALHKENALLQRVIKLALDPYINFYIKKIPKYTTTPIMDGYEYKPLEYALDQLTLLSERTLTGNAAILHLSTVLSSVSANDAVVVSRIIGKDLRCGIAAATVNAVFKDLVPVYPCLLARPYDTANAANIVFPAYSQLKADGVRANAVVKDGAVSICGRSGRIIDVLGFLDDDILKIGNLYGTDIFLDGELVVVDGDGKVIDRKTGNGIIGKAIKGTISEEEASSVRLHIWDAFPLDEFVQGQSKDNYRTRYQVLHDKMQIYSGTKVSLIDTKIVNDWGEAEAHFQEMLHQGEEGVIVKNFSGIWSNTRSEHLVKMKAEREADLEVIGYNPGTGQFDGMVGSLICSSSDGAVVVAISGFSVAVRHKITEEIDSIIGRIITVVYNSRISSTDASRTDVDSLFLPRFKQFRNDKTVADSSAEIK